MVFVCSAFKHRHSHNTLCFIGRYFFIEMLFAILICSALLHSHSVFGVKTEPNSSNGTANTRTSVAHGTAYGCSEKFVRPYCWKYCSGDSGSWCYTESNYNSYCNDDQDCYYKSVCSGWCAWNSDSGCSKSCHEIPPQSSRPRPYCGRGRPYYLCQSSYGDDGWRSMIATTGKWISADIQNENFMNDSANTLKFVGNKATSTKDSTSVPQTALWFPMGAIKSSSNIFYWTFTVRELEIPSGSYIHVGISDLSKVAPGWSVKGLFYGGSLSDGSGQLIGDFGPKLKVGDKCSILVKLIDERIKMYVFLNDTPLGLAYDVPKSTLEGIYPVVKFTGKGSVKIREGSSSDIPVLLEPVKPLEIEGNWTLHKLAGNEAGARETKVTMKLHPTTDRVYDQAYGLRIHIKNKFMGKIYKKSTLIWVGEIVDKTTKQGTTVEMKMEDDIAKHINGITNVVLDVEKAELNLQSSYSSSVWKQIEARRTTVNYDPFNKKKN